MAPFRIGLLGRGTVGEAFRKLVGERAPDVVVGVVHAADQLDDQLRALEDLVE